MVNRKATAVVVEDNANLRRALVQAVQAAGYSVAAASTVAEALALLDPPPDVVLLDLNLPDGLGTTILQKVRGENLPTKVAILTGATHPALLAEVSGLGPDIVFGKADDLQKLLDWLQAMRP